MIGFLYGRMPSHFKVAPKEGLGQNKTVVCGHQNMFKKLMLMDNNVILFCKRSHLQKEKFNHIFSIDRLLRGFNKNPGTT